MWGFPIMIPRRRFLLDENVDVRLGAYLKQEGQEVVLVPKGIRNGDVLALAAKKQCILVTHDTDFLDVFLTHSNHAFPIIVLRIHPPTRDRIIASFSLFLPRFETVNGLVIYELTPDGFLLHEGQER